MVTDAPLLIRLRDELPQLSAVIVARIASEVPSFRTLPAEVLNVEIRAAVAESFGLVLGSLIEERDLTADRMGTPLRKVMLRVRDRPSFADILRAYFIGARVGWERLLEQARPAELPELVATVGPLARQLQRLFAAAAQAYLDEQVLVHGEAGEARRELAAALLTGTATDSLAKRAGVPVAGAYAVLAWRTVSAGSDLAETTLIRRRVRAALNDGFRATVLNVLDEHGGTALVPADDEEDVLGTLRTLVGDLSRIVAEPVIAAASEARTAGGLPEAVREAGEVLDVALRLRKPAGLYALDDLLLEVQLARPSIAGERLAERLMPLRSRPELLTTLRTFARAKHSRRRASALLHVHPNTLDYRLRRITEFTGLDPTQPAEMQVLSAALTITDLRAAGG